ncbi:pyruvate carboxyltransferase [Streptomyces sp. ME02-8801-2C]|uniref:LeuA family protein n=1 Tax=Streptomyces sp. ME02-8801-2C TaxID=3028680 RepID=UPI0029AE8F4E|nr:pyruvate carboxyltransferase [Streptomyces sp. ME02-8801-2C]MDX3455869.1 pyruvate carboxyltransferase [Streptomyces sp. ME02-8801-2C]
MNDQATPRRISVFDTTLRDGEQAPGNAMTPDQKLELALLIAGLGVDTIEAGFPASSPSDFEATRLISQELAGTRFATFSRTTRRDVALAVEAGGVDNHQVQMVATGSQIHLTHKRGISRHAAVQEVVDTVRFAASLGVTDIAVGIEDASRGADDLLRALTESAVDAGATCIILADTTGCHTPDEFGALIGKIRRWAPEPVKVSTHCHNDFGLATANTLAGLAAGADEVQVALGGIGERAGNTSLEEVAAVLAYKSEILGLTTDIRLDTMYPAYQRLREIIRLEEPRNKPIFGKYVFGTAAGIHQQGMLSDPSTYEYVEPARFGRERSLLIGRHSGRTVLRHLLEQLSVQVGEDELDELYRVHIAERAQGDCEDLSVVRERLARDLGERANGGALTTVGAGR